VGVRPRPRKLTDADGQATDRRSQIVDAAARLFAVFGYEATSVRQIADEVNILAGSLYHHFATKDEMLHDFLAGHLLRMAGDNQLMARLAVDAEHRLVANVIMRFRQYVEYWEFHTVLLQEGRFFRRHKDFAYVVKAKSAAFAVQQAILRDGIASGLFRPDIDTYLMIGTISRVLSSAAAWFRSGDIFSSDKPAHYSLDTVIDFHLDCVLRMVRAPSRLADPIPRESCEQLLYGDDGAGETGQDR
jgi:AcrR family transcriptional regulator